MGTLQIIGVVLGLGVLAAAFAAVFSLGSSRQREKTSNDRAEVAEKVKEAHEKIENDRPVSVSDAVKRMRGKD